MEPILIEIWLPYDEFLAFWLVLYGIYVVARWLWRLLPVIGG